MSRKSFEGNNRFSFSQWNRALSIRSSNRSSTSSTPPSTTTSTKPHRFSLHSLRTAHHPPDPSKRLHRLIKSTNLLTHAHSTAAKERLSIATQLSSWGEASADPALSDVSDKVGVILSELGEQEESYARALDGARSALKTVRDTERSAGGSRVGRERVAGEIARVKGREPGSARLVVLEQELVRAEAEGLVAEAQVGNVTRQKLKEAYAAEFLATIERAEKQMILARHGLRLLQVLDDTPMVPGDERPPYEGAAQTRQILNDAEDDLRDWQLPEGLLGDLDGGGDKMAAGDVTPTPGRGNGKSPDRGSVVGGV